MPFVDEISEERSTVSTVSSVTAQTRQRVSSIKIRYKLAVKSDSPLILYSANFRYKIANFLRGRWDTGQEGDERRERKMVARTGDKNFAGGKKGGATGTQNAGSIRERVPRETNAARSMQNRYALSRVHGFSATKPERQKRRPSANHRWKRALLFWRNSL